MLRLKSGFVCKLSHHHSRENAMASVYGVISLANQLAFNQWNAGAEFYYTRCTIVNYRTLVVNGELAGDKGW